MNNSTTTEDMEHHLPYELYGLTPALATLHAFTLLAYLILARIIYKGVDIDHPIFAVIFQEAIFIPLLELAGVAALLLSVWLKSEVAVNVYVFVGRVCWMFHPVTWVVVSYLR